MMYYQPLVSQHMVERLKEQHKVYQTKTPEHLYMFPVREQVRTAHWSTHDQMMLLWSKEILSPYVQQESKDYHLNFKTCFRPYSAGFRVEL